LANEWYVAPIPRKELKAFARRSDLPGILHFGGYFAALAGLGVAAYVLVGRWWLFVPVYLAYSMVFAFSEAAWHETVHGTAFKSRWLNRSVNFVASFMGHRDVVLSTWSHAIHHSYTNFKGTDPELQAPRPPNLFVIALNFFRLQGSLVQLWMMVQHAAGRTTPLARRIVPESDWRKLFWNARLFLGLYLVLIGWSIAIESWLPIIFLFLPRFFGAWLLETVVTMQHPGLAEDVWDHRLNTRTVRVPRWVQFLYFNMNYHIEHHMYPLVPFHALAGMHERVKDHYPRKYQGIWSVYRDLVPTLVRQVKDPDHFIEQELPPEGGWSSVHHPSSPDRALHEVGV
jgi:fatty acid desaturase